MTAQVSPNPVFQALGTNGLPLAFGLLGTYVAGTATPQATWTDSTQSTQNTNPVVLNALGQANVWTDPNKVYKFILQDAAGNQLYAIDNIQGAGAVTSLLSSFGADSGSANAYVYTHAAASAAATLTAGVLIRFTPVNSNTGASTVNADGTGAVAVVGEQGSALTGGELSSLGPVILQYTGTAWQIVATTGAQPPNNRTAAEIAAGVTPTNYTYPPGNVLRYGADPTGVASSQTAIQNTIAVCESNLETGGYDCVIPAGTYKRTAKFVFTKRFIRIRGGGMLSCGITSTGVTDPFFQVNAIALWSPDIRDLYLSDTSSGHGFDLSLLTPTNAFQCYLFNFRNLMTFTGGAAIFATNVFNGSFENWFSQSTSNHAFMAICGPSVSWRNCYASNTAAGKAGYRLGGLIDLIDCNGVDSADYWGIFGQNPSDTDGFQHDFPNGAGGFVTDLPGIKLQNCNVENFAGLSTTASGIMIHNSPRYFDMDGGKIERDGLSTNFHSYIRNKQSSILNVPLRLNPAVVFTGSGSPAQTGGFLYADNYTYFEDRSSALANAATPITTSYQASITATVPTIQWSGVVDVSQDAAISLSAISPRRISLQMTRFSEPAALTPVGAAQAIDVTGHTKVIVTPAAAASISTATFTATAGIGSDNGRNAWLIIEAGNGNLTINHTATGANVFVMTGGANVAMASGQVMVFMRSETNGNWRQQV